MNQLQLHKKNITKPFIVISFITSTLAIKKSFHFAYYKHWRNNNKMIKTNKIDALSKLNAISWTSISNQIPCVNNKNDNDFVCIQVLNILLKFSLSQQICKWYCVATKNIQTKHLINNITSQRYVTLLLFKL